MVATADSGAGTADAVPPFEIGSDHTAAPPLVPANRLNRARYAMFPLVDAAGVADRGCAGPLLFLGL